MGKNICKNETTDKGLISKISKHLLKLKTKKQTTLTKNKKQKTNKQKKWAEDLNRQFSKEDREMAKKHKMMFNIANYQRNENQKNEIMAFAATQKNLEITTVSEVSQ